MKNIFLFVLVTIFAIVFTMVCFIWFSNKNNMEQTGFLHEPNVETTTNKNVAQTEILVASDDNSTFDDYQAEQKILRTLRYISDEENMPEIPRTVRMVSDEEIHASTLHYTAPPDKILIPQEYFDYFFHKYKDKDSTSKKWKHLREVGVSAGSLEVRVAYGGSFIADGGVYRLCRNGGEWTGFFTSSDFRFYKFHHNGDEWVGVFDASAETGNHPEPIFALTPRTDWATFWGKLETLGILTLPDDSFFDSKEIFGGEGPGYTVEINDGEHYRIYAYLNPQNLNVPEAKQIIEIIKTLQNEFQYSIPKIINNP